MDYMTARVKALRQMIEKSCQICGLNLTVHDGKIGFVDQEHKKIVAVWEPEYTVNDIPKGET